MWQEIYEFDQNVHFVEIEIEEDQEIVELVGIMGTPRVQFLEYICTQKKKKKINKYICEWLCRDIIHMYMH